MKKKKVLKKIEERLEDVFSILEDIEELFEKINDSDIKPLYSNHDLIQIGVEETGKKWNDVVDLLGWFRPEYETTVIDITKELVDDHLEDDPEDKEACDLMYKIIGKYGEFTVHR